MKLSHAKTAFMALALLAVSTATGCSVVNGIRAKNQLNEGARAYKAGHFPEAQEHFEKALELNPEQKNAPFFIARAIHAQYKPGVDAPENIAKAREAIAAYQRVLDQDPNNDEAYNAEVYLYRSIKDEGKEQELLEARAKSGNASKEKRAQAYTVLSSKQWNCSYAITEQKELKQTVKQGDKTVFQYKKPSNQKDFDQAQKCVADGLELIEQALSLDPNSEQAWSYKTNLLLERVKLDEMDGKNDKKAEDQKQADAARDRTAQLSEQNKKKKEEEDKAKEANKSQAAS